MPKTKFKNYYPLYVCKKTLSLLKDYPFTVNEMEILSSENYSDAEKDEVIEATAKRIFIANNSVLALRTHDDISDETLASLDFILSMHKWSLNKQVFKFDKDFLDELIKTGGFHITKGMFNFLPCKTMYFDLSDNPYIQDTYGVPGAFVNVIHVESSNEWEIHMFAMQDDDLKYSRFVLPLEYEDVDFSWDNEFVAIKMLCNALKYGPDMAASGRKRGQFNVLILQMLIYLSSIEPDIRESEFTKNTYRPRTSGSVVKNKFSEIQQHEVGVRYGTAYRKYIMHRESSGGSGEHKGCSKRPHFRKAHWSFYWYNVLDENGEKVYNVYGVPEKVKRQKWISEVYVNESYGESDVIIHEVKSQLDDELNN